MRGKELNEVKIIDLLLRYGRLKLTGDTGDSLWEKFENKTADADGIELPVSEKTLKRQVDELCKDGLLERGREGYYSINEAYFVTEKSLDRSEWKEVLNRLLENNELDAYRYIRNYLAGNHKNILLDNLQLKKYSETVRESVHILSNHQEVIQKINRAFTENCLIRVGYKGKEYTVYPVCYVVSRDGTRKYLYGVRRKKLLPPMELNAIEFLGYSDKTDIDRTSYRTQIQAAWDIDVQPCTVRVLVRKNKEGSYPAIRRLQHFLGRPVEEEADSCIYEGEIIGINDFKTWLRSHAGVCMVLKPDFLREELIRSLQEKYKRYGGEHESGITGSL